MAVSGLYSKKRFWLPHEVQHEPTAIMLKEGARVMRRYQRMGVEGEELIMRIYRAMERKRLGIGGRRLDPG